MTFASGPLWAHSNAGAVLESYQGETLLADTKAQLDERPLRWSLFPDKAFEFGPIVQDLRAHFFQARLRKGPDPYLRLRFQIEDPDRAIEALGVEIDGRFRFLIDADGVVQGRDPVGFAEASETPFFVIPKKLSSGPHGLRLKPFLRKGFTTSRVSGKIRLLGATFFDAIEVFQGIRDISDRFQSRYRILRDLDLSVRRVNPAFGTEVEPYRIDHPEEIRRLFLEPRVLSHLHALNAMTFESRQTRTEAGHFFADGVQVFDSLWKVWATAHPDGRTSRLYASTTQLYEAFDEISIAWKEVREAYYPLATLLEDQAGMLPVAPMRRALNRLIVAFGRTLALVEEIHSELEAIAEQISEVSLTTAKDYPQAEAACMDGRLGPESSMKFEPSVLKTRGKWKVEGYLRSSSSLGLPEGVGRGTGSSCSTCPSSPVQDRDIRKDRYAPERALLRKYLEQVRILLGLDLRLAEVWEAFLEGRRRPGGLVRTLAWDLPALARGEESFR